MRLWRPSLPTDYVTLPADTPVSPPMTEYRRILVVDGYAKRRCSPSYTNDRHRSSEGAFSSKVALSASSHALETPLRAGGEGQDCTLRKPI